MTMRDRVKELRRVPASELRANPKNWRRHPPAQEAALRGVLEDIGFADAVIARETPDGLELIDGHLRQEVMGDQPVPVLIVDVTEEEADKMLLTLDPLAMMATADTDQLLELLRDNPFESQAVNDMLEVLANGESMPVLHEPPVDPGPQIDRADELREKWQTERGQVWEVGRHRLMCGDCTDESDITAIMAGTTTDAVVTDPPYGQDQEGVPHDSPSEQVALYEGCLAALPLSDRATIVAFQSPRLFPSWLDAIRQYGHKFERLLWVYKPPAQVYPWRGWLLKSEVIIVSSVGGGTWREAHPVAHDCYLVNIVGKEIQDGGSANNHGPMWHGAIKALEVVQDLVNRVGEGRTVYDPFLGSGTTMVAAEQLGRICYGMEIEPKYVAVILERMAGMGLEPKLVTG